MPDDSSRPDSKRGFSYEWLVPILMAASPMAIKVADSIGTHGGWGAHDEAVEEVTLHDVASMEDATLAEPEEGRLALHVINVGQGDGMAVQCPSGEVGMVIDSADSREPSGTAHFREYIDDLMDQDSDHRIEMVLVTHPHSDHMGASKWLIDKYDMDTYVDNGEQRKGTGFKNLMASVKARIDAGTKYFSVGGPHASDPGNKKIPICGGDEVVIEFLVPAVGYTGCSRSPNRCSIVTRLDYGQTSFLLAGDAEREQERLLRDDPYVSELLDVDVLKAGHHASDTSSTPPFLEATSPSCILVSVGLPGAGQNAHHKHPRLSTIEHFNEVLLAGEPDSDWRAEFLPAYSSETGQWVDARILDGISSTSIDGDIVIESDGEVAYCLSD